MNQANTNTNLFQKKDNLSLNGMKAKFKHDNGTEDRL